MVLQDLSTGFGQGMAEWVQRGIGRELGWHRVDEIVDNIFHNSEEARKTKSLVELVFNNPSEDEIPYLYRLLGASFLANSVRLDPSAASILKSALSSYELHLDTNILLPLIIEEHDDHSFMKTIMQSSRDVGVKLCVIQPMFDEICGHRDRATRTFEECNGENIQLKELIQVLGKRANCFLQGYLNSIESNPDLTWVSYRENYSNTKIQDSLLRMGITIVKNEELSAPGRDYQYVLDGITQEWARRERGNERAPILNENEALQFLYVYRRRRAIAQRNSNPQIWFLSYETVLANVFRRNVEKWISPPTFPFSAWVAFLDSRLPFISKNPKTIVNAILKGTASAFDLPDPVALVRKKAFGDRVTTKAEEEATQLALSGFHLVKRVEIARNAVLSRSDKFYNPAEESINARKEAVGEIDRALNQTIDRLTQQIQNLKQQLNEKAEPIEPKNQGKNNNSQKHNSTKHS